MTSFSSETSQFLNSYSIYLKIILALSLLCSVILVTTWFVIPRWRTTHNFICVNQITAGVLNLAAENILIHSHAYFPPLLLIKLLHQVYKVGFETSVNIVKLLYGLETKLKEYLFMLSLCWSLCGQLHAYTRLVLVLPGPDHTDDRRWALLFSFGTLAMIKCITDLIVPFVFKYTIFHNFGENLDVYYVRWFLTILPSLIVLTLNLLLYFNIASALLSRGGVRGVGRGRGRRLVGLLGVTILSDLLALLIPTIQLIAFYVCELFHIVPAHDYKISIILLTFRFMFDIRLVIQTIVVLFNVRSRQEFARYFELRRYRQLNRVV